MNSRHLSVALVTAFALAGCGGGGGTTATPDLAPATPPQVLGPQSTASIPMTFTFKKASSSAARKPSYLSNATQSLALYDGSALVYVVNIELDSGNQFATVYAADGSTTVAPGSCSFTESEASCSFVLTTTTGPHKFDVITYPSRQGVTTTSLARHGIASTGRTISQTGTPPAFSGVILSEGELSVTLVAGANPAKTLSLNGIADQTDLLIPSELAYNTGVDAGFRILDSGSQQILTPGTYDNGPVTVTASPTGLVTIVPSTFSSPPPSSGDQSFTVTCTNTAGGDVTISFNAGTHPNTAYASGLTYSASNYAPAIIGQTSLTCDAEPATIPITVDSKARR